jgi:DnaJ-domain-containing protein 1
MSQYHPDKVNSLGPEFRELAESKSKEINRAFDLLARFYR